MYYPKHLQLTETEERGIQGMIDFPEIDLDDICEQASYAINQLPDEATRQDIIDSTVSNIMEVPDDVSSIMDKLDFEETLNLKRKLQQRAEYRKFNELNSSDMNIDMEALKEEDNKTRLF